jgi:hypothetical protein
VEKDNSEPSPARLVGDSDKAKQALTRTRVAEHSTTGKGPALPVGAEVPRASAKSGALPAGSPKRAGF